MKPVDPTPLKTWPMVPCPGCGGAGERPDNLAQWLRLKRHAAGLSQREMGVRVGLTSMSISDIENGNRPVVDAVYAEYRKL